jgi:drug/metabolite transporter (DMT)-like permease
MQGANYNVMPIFVFLIIFFADFYIIWPIFKNHYLPKIKNLKFWQKCLILSVINIVVSIFMTYSAYEVSSFVYNEWIVKK